MSYRVDFSAADLNYQIELLKLYPEIANKNFYPAVNRSVRVTKSNVGSLMKFNDLSGRTRATFGAKVSGKGVNITGRVGWFGKGAVHTANLLEYGVRPHAIGSGMHPGYAPYGFMEDGYSASEPYVVNEMERAQVQTVNDLAVK